MGKKSQLWGWILFLCTEWRNSHTKRFLQQIHNLERERQKRRTAKMYEHRLCLRVLMAFWEYEKNHLNLFLLSLSWHSSFIRDQQMNELLNPSPFVCHLLPLMQAGRERAQGLCFRLNPAMRIYPLVFPTAVAGEVSSYGRAVVRCCRISASN